jgi:hypothetical protein
MHRFVRLALAAAEMATIPVAGCFIELDPHQPDWQSRRPGLSQLVTSSDDAGAPQFRFRVPRLSDIRDLVPKLRLQSRSADHLCSTLTGGCGASAPTRSHRLVATPYEALPAV